MLKGKTIVLGVTGSIAAYKMANVASMLVKRGCEVHVVMTKNATNFINPIAFETLTDAITDSSLETKESSTVPNESLEPHKFFCPNCKNEMQEDDVFCNECGTKVK